MDNLLCVLNYSPIIPFTTGLISVYLIFTLNLLKLIIPSLSNYGAYVFAYHERRMEFGPSPSIKFFKFFILCFDTTVTIYI